MGIFPFIMADGSDMKDWDFDTIPSGFPAAKPYDPDLAVPVKPKPAICKKCNSMNPFMDETPGYVCFECR